MQKRKWVKIAAIAFFAVLLLITFFSNTLRNWSLPEVSVKSVTSGTIVPIVTGNGVTQAASPENILAEFSGKLISVDVTEGEKVTAGQRLMTVEYEDDGSLKILTDQLDNLESAYEQALLSASVQRGSAEALQLQQLQNSLSAAQTALRRCEEYGEKRAALDKEAATANETLTAAQKAYDNAVEAYRAAFTEAQVALSDAQSWQQNAQANENYYHSLFEADPKETNRSLWEAASAELEKASAEVNVCQNSHYAAQTALQERQRAHQPAVDAAQASVDQSSSKLLALEAEYAGCTELVQCKNQVLSARSALESFYEQQRASEVGSEITSLQLNRQKEEINDLKKEIAEKEALLGKQEIRASEDGVVFSLSAEAEFQTGTVLATVHGGNGSYRLQFSVPIEKALLLTVGTEAAVTNQRVGDISVQLSQILPDEADPLNSKTLVFSVEGEDAAAGQALSVAISLQKSLHDAVVPNEALFEDSRGVFVFTVTTKATALGSRSYVQRVDVSVVRSDDRYSAIDGLNAGEYVVVLSSKPLSSGMAVRFGSEAQ